MELSGSHVPNTACTRLFIAFPKPSSSLVSDRFMCRSIQTFTYRSTILPAHRENGLHLLHHLKHLQLIKAVPFAHSLCNNGTERHDSDRACDSIRHYLRSRLYMLSIRRQRCPKAGEPAHTPNQGSYGWYSFQRSVHRAWRKKRWRSWGCKQCNECMNINQVK